MKFKKICFIFTLICICMGATLFLSGCQSTDNCVITSAESFRMSDTYLYTAVSNDTVKFTFYDKIKVSDNCVWSLHLDSAALDSLTINSKTINLEIGDNIYYILVKTTDGKNVKLYTVNVRRRPIYTVTFKNYDGTNFEVQQIEEGGKATMPFNTPQYDGAIFNFWKFEFSQGISSNKIIYGNFTLITYNIEYELYSGNNDIANPNSYTVSTNSITLKDPHKAHFDFLGWYNNPNFSGTAISQIKKGSIGNIKLFAKWQIHNYSISYNLNGGENSSENPNVFTIFDLPFQLHEPTKKGYKFICWESNGKEIQQINTSTDFSLVAKWELINYKITYDLGFNDVFNDNVSSYNILSDSFKIKNPEKLGYKFLGWTTLSDTTLKSNFYIQKGDIGGKHFIANWQIITYQIKYSLDGGVNNKDNPEEYTVNDLPINLKNPTFEGENFVKWINVYDNTEVKFIYALNMQDFQVKAIWSIDNVVVKNYPKVTASGVLDSSVTELIVSNKIKKIEKGAFKNCQNLTSISLPFVGMSESATEEYEKVFGYIFDYYSTNNSSLNGTYQCGYKSGIDRFGRDVYTNFYYYIPTTLTSVSITNATSIPKHAFYNCDFIKNINLCDGITSIGEKAFGLCEIKNIIIPKSVKEIDKGIFSSCRSVVIFLELEQVPASWNSYENWNNERPIYLYSDIQPTTDGKYWHYNDNKEIVIWE